MNREMIVKLAAEAAVNAAMSYIDQQRRKEVKSRHDKRLRNTKLLLKHYNLFKDHCKNSISNMKNIPESTEENPIDILDSLESFDRGVYVESIKRSVTRTYIILNHIDEMMNLYKAYCTSSGKTEELRRFRIIQMAYFDKVSPADICEKENIDQSTYYRDIREACSKLSALLFGIDGISSMRKI